MVTCQRTPIERKQLWESIMGINVELVICMLDAVLRTVPNVIKIATATTRKLSHHNTGNK